MVPNFIISRASTDGNAMLALLHFFLASYKIELLQQFLRTRKAKIYQPQKVFEISGGEKKIMNSLTCYYNKAPPKHDGL